MLREYALNTGAAGPVPGIAFECVKGDAKRGHIADKFIGERSRSLCSGDPQSGARLQIGDPRGLQRREKGNQGEWQQGAAQNEKNLCPGGQSGQREGRPVSRFALSF
ncbi:hypothetical protein GCM10011329_12580 [Stakelama pacifica]|nr:hypothetical protein GCM10011329_12580 [Stakelama pacifica]